MKTNAIILAAGLSSRFAPLSYDTPKGLLKVKDEILIERQIKQLMGGGISEIHIVVGYKKEQFEYLKEKYNVNIIYNPDYNTKNNFASLYHARKYLKNTYILSSDNYLTINPYKQTEQDSWYMGVYANSYTKEWIMSEDEQGYINDVKIGGKDAYFMLGPVYFSAEFSKKFKIILQNTYNDISYNDCLWEELFINNLNTLKMKIKKVKTTDIYEFDSLEELREFDFEYKDNSNNEYLQTISKVFNIKESKITKCKALDKGMTNKSFYFEINNEGYIFRIPGKATNAFINRQNEKSTYQAIKHLNIDDNPIYLDEKTGIKITKFITNARAINPRNSDELINTMMLAKQLHNANIKVPYFFDFETKINKFENLCLKYNLTFNKDYLKVKSNISELLTKLKTLDIKTCLSHMDLVSDNVLYADEKYMLIDWEYAAMCDPLADISLFSIYAYFDKAQTDELAYTYFGNKPNKEQIFRIYSYMALGGLLWYLWSLVQNHNGANFYEYAQKQYQYAKDFYKYAKQTKFI